VALPDTLKVNPGSPTSYPNGRGLEDDVIDILLGLITNLNGGAAIPGVDGVDANDVPFLPAFPYMAEPHQAAP
jgi:hypothetical protein